jgi:hypothetical protein
MRAVVRAIAAAAKKRVTAQLYPGSADGYPAFMERQSTEDVASPSSDNSDIDDLGVDDGEFASVEDVGPEPQESPMVDDV